MRFAILTSNCHSRSFTRFSPCVILVLLLLRFKRYRVSIRNVSILKVSPCMHHLLLSLDDNGYLHFVLCKYLFIIFDVLCSSQFFNVRQEQLVRWGK